MRGCPAAYRVQLQIYSLDDVEWGEEDAQRGDRAHLNAGLAWSAHGPHPWHDWAEVVIDTVLREGQGVVKKAPKTEEGDQKEAQQTNADWEICGKR